MLLGQRELCEWTPSGLALRSLYAHAREGNARGASPWRCWAQVGFPQLLAGRGRSLSLPAPPRQCGSHSSVSLQNATLLSSPLNPDFGRKCGFVPTPRPRPRMEETAAGTALTQQKAPSPSLSLSSSPSHTLPGSPPCRGCRLPSFRSPTLERRRQQAGFGERHLPGVLLGRHETMKAVRPGGAEELGLLTLALAAPLTHPHAEIMHKEATGQQQSRRHRDRGRLQADKSCQVVAGKGSSQPKLLEPLGSSLIFAGVHRDYSRFNRAAWEGDSKRAVSVPPGGDGIWGSAL